MRGKLIGDYGARGRGGITPAHAGKTQLCSKNVYSKWDHPRACGENLALRASSRIFQGSPPRMRGKQKSIKTSASNSGITPAHAGKTQSRAYAPSRAQDHPRACGENGLTAEEALLNPGSPPRMRGKPLIRDHDTGLHGITPAHAGKTDYTENRRSDYRDHPRACGENMKNGLNWPNGTGSPPRMRGKRIVQLNTDGIMGITPAHAGKTQRFAPFLLLIWDHPRACGENWPHRLL